MDYLQLAAAAAQNNRTVGTAWRLDALPPPLCWFDTGSTALAALVMQAQVAAGMTPTGLVCADTLAALAPPAPAKAKPKTKAAKAKAKA